MGTLSWLKLARMRWVMWDSSCEGASAALLLMPSLSPRIVTRGLLTEAEAARMPCTALQHVQASLWIPL